MASLSPRGKVAAGAVATLLALVGVLQLSRGTTSSRHTTANAVPSDGSAALMLAERTRGDSLAPITIWEFSDFQCPFCRVFFSDIMPTLEREYLRAGKARLIYVNFPLPRLHANATLAHEFAMCAAREKRFWPYHDLLYRHQGDWDRLPDPAPYFRGLADSAGVGPAVSRCVESHASAWLVAGEAEAARKAGLTGTPSFVIEGTLYSGTFAVEEWRRILDQLYAAKAGSGR